MKTLKIRNKILTFTTITSLAFVLSGCFGTSFTKVGTTITGQKVAITKKDIHIKTKMSETIFLEPVSPEQQIVYFKFRNTSDEQLDIVEKLKNEFTKKGFKTTLNPQKANFIVQANLLKIGQMDLNEQKQYLDAGFGAGAIFAMTTMLTGGEDNSGKAAVAGAILGLIVEAAKVDNVHYAMVTDIEIRQRPLDGEVVTQETNSNSKMGFKANSIQSSISKNVKWKKYRTRIVSSAYAPALEFEQAKPFLEQGLIRVLAGTM